MQFRIAVVIAEKNRIENGAAGEYCLMINDCWLKYCSSSNGTFQPCNFLLEFPEILSKNHAISDWVCFQNNPWWGCALTCPIDCSIQQVHGGMDVARLHIVSGEAIEKREQITWGWWFKGSSLLHHHPWFSSVVLRLTVSVKENELWWMSKVMNYTLSVLLIALLRLLSYYCY